MKIKNVLALRILSTGVGVFMFDTPPLLAPWGLFRKVFLMNLLEAYALWSRGVAARQHTRRRFGSVTRVAVSVSFGWCAMRRWSFGARNGVDLVLVVLLGTVAAGPEAVALPLNGGV